MTLGIRRDPAHPWAKFCPFRWPGTKSRRYIDDFFLRARASGRMRARERKRQGRGKAKGALQAAKERRKEEKGRKDEREDAEESELRATPDSRRAVC